MRRHLASMTATLTVERVAANPDSRELSGVLIPYGQIGYTSIGPVIVPGPGRITMLDADLTRIKLVDEHQKPARGIGYMTAVRDTDTALRGAYAVAETLDGERAWSEYHGGARDAFSVELIDIWLEDNPTNPEVPFVASATLKATAFVVTPAWADARPDGLAASLHLEGTTMNDTQRARLRELAALNTRDEAQESEYAELSALAVQEATAETEPEPEPEPEPTAPAQAQRQAEPAMASRVARVPRTSTATPRRSGRPIGELFAAMARVGSGQSRPELEAALSDITSSANIWTSRDDYAGQLWSGLAYNRRFVPLMQHADLTSYKGTGWRWDVRPEVADYAGDKAAVPSNNPTTEEVPWSAARLAGAHDIDRKFFDFGDQEFIDAYYTAMRESYAMKSDDKARLFLLASASAGGSAGAGSDLFRAAGVAASIVETNTNGQVADYFLINPTDRLALLDVTEADIPAYLEAFGVTPEKFIATPGQVAGTVTAGARPSATFRELSETPIRVEAINLANGGIDGGVFGYYAESLNFEGGIVKVTFGA